LADGELERLLADGRVEREVRLEQAPCVLHLDVIAVLRFRSRSHADVLFDEVRGLGGLWLGRRLLLRFRWRLRHRRVASAEGQREKRSKDTEVGAFHSTALPQGAGSPEGVISGATWTRLPAGDGRLLYRCSARGGVETREQRGRRPPDVHL